jgi:hypothetical protein
MDIEELILLKEHSQLLVMHSWRKEIPLAHRNIIIAEALNSCTVDENFHITGYLITNRRVFVVGWSETTPFQRILQHFYRKVAEGIFNYKKHTYQLEDEPYLEARHTNTLFTTYPFYNNHIRTLITGKKLVSAYYDPHIERLKEYIKYHNYCSALDYDGGKSPVFVNTNTNL